MQATGNRIALARHRETYLVSVQDSVISRKLYFSGEYDFEKFLLTLSLLGWRRMRHLVDVGANLGSICIPAVARGYASSAVAIEPDPSNFCLLECNVRLNGLTASIATRQVAATSKSGAVELTLSQENLGDHRVLGSSGVFHGDRATVAVDGLALDDLVEELSPATDLVWMDIQGHELHALAGAERIMAAGVPILMEFWPFGMKEQDSLSQISPLANNYR